MGDFWNPSSFLDYRLGRFLVQVIVIILMALCFFKISYCATPEVYNTEGGFLHSISENWKCSPDDDKKLYKFPYLSTDDTIAKHEKMIDLEAGGLWLTDSQAGLFAAIILATYLSGVVFTIMGIGIVYKIFQKISFVITALFLPWFIIIVPFGIWVVVMSFVMLIPGVMTIVLWPLILLMNLVLGIIQLVGSSR